MPTKPTFVPAGADGDRAAGPCRAAGRGCARGQGASRLRRRPRPATRRGRVLLAGAATLIAGSLFPIAAFGGSTSAGSVVSAVPASYTPDVQTNATGQPRSEVDAIVGVGSQVVVGGQFANGVTQSQGSPVIHDDYLFAMAASSPGTISSSFRPVLDGPVYALLAGPTVNGHPTVYVGGGFSHVNGAAAGRLVLLDLATGKAVGGFNPPTLGGQVHTLGLANGQLLVGGDFPGGLMSLNPSTGARTSYLTLGVAGHHNWYPGCSTCAKGAVGVLRIAVAPDGRHAVIVGNFKQVGGQGRDQIALLDLGSSATLSSWSTPLYTARCGYTHYDSYVRDVAFSPGGTFFAVSATGGGGMPRPFTEGCDAVARFELSSSPGSAPAWVDYAGNDTTYCVAVSDSAVYVGGHNRWMNNDRGSDYAGPGAVPRPGLSALDPANGLPYSWNPGRNPRGVDVFVLTLTQGGLWFGTDTDYVGNYRYYRAKLAFFPSAGGETLPGDQTPSLPGHVYLGVTGPSGLVRRSYSPPSTVSGTSAVSTTPNVNWGLVHGAFMVNGALFYLCAPASGARCDSSGHAGLFRASFNGSSVGTPAWVQPFNDPAWENVATGSGGKTPTYVGEPPPLYGIAGSVTGLTYAGGYLYYTTSGSSSLFRVSFEAEDGVVGSVATPVGGGSFPHARGLFASGGYLYWVDGSGHLERTALSGGRVSGGSTVVSSTSWANHGIFVGP